VVGLKDANITEFEKDCENPVICLLEEQREITDMGGSMRLGTWPTEILPGSLAEKVYGTTKIFERHRHRYEFNMNYREQLLAHGYVIAGTSPNGDLVELMELPSHAFFLACQYHPEFRSKPNVPHPLFKGFLKAVLAHGVE
jgi:CTP synthase